MTTHSQTKSTLMRARTLLTNRRNWTRGTFRYRLAGTAASDEPESYAYCAIGAIQQAANAFGNNDLLGAYDRAAEQAARTALRRETGMSIDVFNDRYASHASLLAKFDAAIAYEGRLAQQEARR